jgi:hypothetical protein
MFCIPAPAVTSHVEIVKVTLILPGQQHFDLVRKAYVIKAQRQHHEENGQGDPVSVHVYLAVVDVFRLAVLQ